MAAPKKISLLPQEGFAYSTLGRIVTWALGVGRIIVVVTELIVILAFLSRFWLDRQLTDLNEKIEGQVALLKTYNDFEQSFVETQTRVASFEKLTKSSPEMEKDAKKILEVIPTSIALSQITVDKSAVQISGFATFEAAVESLLGILQSLKLGEVELTSLTVSPDEQLGIKFTILINRPAKNGG